MVDFNKIKIYSEKRARIVKISDCQGEAMMEALKEMSYEEVDILENFFEKYNEYRKWK